MKNSLVSAVLCLIIAVSITGCGASAPPVNEPAETVGIFSLRGDDTHPVVIINTSMGMIMVRLDAERAPVTVRNFLSYIESGFYTNTVFHRVIPGVLIQGGGLEAGSLRRKSTQSPITNESPNGLSNIRGSIAMARTNALDSATSQFYINLTDNSQLDSSRYAVFGEVIIGMDTADRISAVPSGQRNGLENVPLNDIVIQSVTLSEQVP